MGVFLILLSFFVLLSVVYLLLRLLLLNSKSKKLLKFSKSLGLSFLEAFSTNEDLRKFGQRHPKFLLFLKKRFDRKNFFGLPLTIFSLSLFYILFLSSGLMVDFLTSTASVAIDYHLEDLLYYFRNAQAVQFFLWLTTWGETEVVLVVLALVSIIFFLLKKYWHMLGLLVSVIGGQACVYLLKMVFDRPRPFHAVYLETTASFPSGHAAAAVGLYGFLGYVLFRHAKTRKKKLWSAVVTLLVIILIGFSRLYLGVHYFSDVLFGQTIGLFWLILGMGLVEWKFFDNKNLFKAEKIKTKLKIVIAGLVALIFGFYIFWGVFSLPQLHYLKSDSTNKIQITDVNYFTSGAFVKYTETLSGSSQEPISLIISVQDEQTLLDIFSKADWLQADSLNSHSILKITKEAIFNNSYSTAPMTPSFWNTQVHTFGFEKATESNTIRQRHHARFWTTDLKTVDGKNIYVGTVSLDTGIKWFITHKISPDIDTERNLLFADLNEQTPIKNFTELQLVKPTLGKNFTGDQFFTDGKAYFVEF